MQPSGDQALGSSGDVHDMNGMNDDGQPSAAQPALTPDMEAETPEAGAVPSGYDWPTHGGYLGCLLAMMPACLVAAFLGSTFVAWLNRAGIVPSVVAGLLVVVLFVVCVVGFGRLGWALGRRFYRKYPQKKPAWGEDEAEAAPQTHAEGQPSEVRDSATR